MDRIEQISSDKSDREEDTKFDMVMETLSWVVEDYLERKWMRKSDSSDRYESISEQEVIDKIKENDWTIDIR